MFFYVSDVPSTFNSLYCAGDSSSACVFFEFRDERIQIRVVKLKAPLGHFGQAGSKSFRLVFSSEHPSAVDILGVVQRRKR
jgi:hypothetical protein